MDGSSARPVLAITTLGWMAREVDLEALLATVAARLSGIGQSKAAAAVAHSEVAGIRWYNDGTFAEVHVTVEVAHYDALTARDLVDHPTDTNEWGHEYNLPSLLDETFLAALPAGTQRASVHVKLLNVPASPSWRREVIDAHGRQLAHLLDRAVLPGDSDIRLHLARLQRLDQEPEELIGASKDLVEAVGKHVLLTLESGPVSEDDVAGVSKRALALLKLHPTAVAPTAKGAETIRHVLGSLQQIAAGIAELRNLGYGTGHGRGKRVQGLRVRHAELAARAAIAFAGFLLDTLKEEDAPWRRQTCSDNGSDDHPPR